VTIKNSLEAYLALHAKLAAEIEEELAREEWDSESVESLADQMHEIECKLPPEVREEMQ